MASQGTQQGLRRAELWDGAASMSVPEHMIDASDIRPVPDNQEFYVDSSSGQAVVIEIVEPVKPPEGEGHAAFCFQDLAQVSGASVTQLHTHTLGVEDVPGLTDAEFIEIAYGVHKVPLRGSHEEHDVHVMLLVARLHGSNGDVMLTFSSPEQALPAGLASSQGIPPGLLKAFKALCQSLHFADKSILF